MPARYKVKIRYKRDAKANDAFFAEVLKPLKINKNALTELSLNRPTNIVLGGFKRINLSDDKSISAQIRNDIFRRGIKYYYQNTMDIATRDYIIIRNNEEVSLDLGNNPYLLDKTIIKWKTCSCENNAGLYEATFTFLGIV